jgi:hypothetical protein
MGACIRQQSFELLKPFFVKPMWDRNTCCCIYQVKLDELRVELNNLQGQTSHSSKVCNQHEYEACAPCKMFYKRHHIQVVQKLNLVNGIGKNACMEIVQLGV